LQEGSEVITRPATKSTASTRSFFIGAVTAFIIILCFMGLVIVFCCFYYIGDEKAIFHTGISIVVFNNVM